MRDAYFFASELYLACGHNVEAAACLQNAREHLLAARLWEKVGQYKRAAASYEREGRMLDAVKLLEILYDYRRAIQILADNNRFDAAIDILKRYEMFNKELKEKKAPAPPDLTRPLGHHTLQNLSYSAAEIYHKKSETTKMLAALESLPTDQDRINFLLKKNYLDEALPIMKKQGQLKEIVKRLRDAGRIKDALKYADRDTCPELRASVLVDLTRISVSKINAESAKDEKDSVIEQAKEAIQLVKGCHGDSESYLTGEAMMLLAMVIDKSDTFRDAMEYCGRKELKILEVELYEHGMQRHGRAFPGIRVAAQFNNLITLLCTIRTQANPLDRKYYADALKYYGLEESKMDPTKKTLIVRKSEGARIVELHSRHAQETGSHPPLVEGTMDAALAQKIIIWSITGKLEWWYRVKVNFLQKDAEKLTQCEVFVTTGGSCGKPAGQCPYMHDHHTRQQFETLVNTLSALIAFDAAVTHRMLQDKTLKEDAPDLHDLFQNKVKDEWLWCRRLMDVLFPAWFHPRIASGMVGQAFYIVQRMREHSPLTREALRRYADHLWETMEVRERHCNTDVLTQILHVMMLCGQNNQELVTKLCKCEDDAMKRAVKVRWGSFFTFKANGETRFLSFFRSILDFIDNIYKRVNEKKQPETGDALQASKHMMDYLTFTAKNCFLPIVPSFSNAVTAMELQFVLLSGMLLQHKRDAVLIIPTSHVCLTRWYDAMCGQRGVTMETAVCKYHAFKEKVHVLTGRLRTLVQLLTGFYRSIYGASHFNMLVDVFSETGIQSGEAERVLVMALTLLLNCGPTSLIPLDLPPPIARDRSVYPAEDMIRIALQNINMDGVEMPERLKGALQVARNAKTKRDVLIGLRTLLTGRQDEALYLGSWGKRPNHSYGVIYQVASPNLAQRLYGHIDMTPVTQARAQFKVSHSPVEQEVEPSVGSEEPEAEELELSDEKVAELVQQQQATHRQQQQQPPDGEMNAAPNDYGMVNENVCMICGVHFVQAYQGGFEEGAEGAEESATENAPVVAPGETRNDHEMSQLHRNQVALFAQFQMVSQQMKPCMAVCATTLNLDFVSNFSEDAGTRENIRNEMMQVQGMKISDLRREMMSISEHLHLLESNRKWADINDVMQRVLWLQNECGMLVAHSNQIARQSLEQKAASNYDEGLVVRDAAFDDGSDDIVDIEPSLRTRYRSRKRQPQGRPPVAK